jgi:protease-4
MHIRDAIHAGLAFALAAMIASTHARADDNKKAEDGAKEAKPTPILVDITLKGSIPEKPAPVGLEGTALKDNLRSLAETLAKAKADDQVKGLVLRIQDLTIGLGKANELRRAIEDFRTSGKKVFALMDDGGNAEYLVACAADEVVMPESGTLMLKGVAAEVMFYKKAFEKYGIQADMLKVGKYKAAAEPYTRSEMSPAFREELTEVLTDNYTMIAEAIAARRGVSLDEAKTLLDGGPYDADDAKAKGLIDRVAYEDQIQEQLTKALGLETLKLETKYGKKTEKVDYSGLAGFMKMMQSLSGQTAKKPESDKPKVALIYATGMIQTGKSSDGGLLGQEVMGSESVVADLKKAAEDKTVKAIVLRVDSPGGSALASDLIWRETVRIEKPIVASMSDVAGSGGYYISMGCDKIFSEPGTLTGSIGVVGGKVALGGLLEKFGVTTDTVAVGKNGLMDSMFRPFSEGEKVAMQRMMESTYKHFVGKAAQGRKLEFSRVEELAGGRIYSGRRAKELGLVDELGTLNDALAEARKLAGMSEDEKELLILPEPKGFLETLLGPLEDMETVMPPTSSGLDAVLPMLPDAARTAFARAAGFARLLAEERVLTILPFEVEIR